MDIQNFIALHTQQKMSELFPVDDAILSNIVEPESGVTILFNTVNRLEQCWQQYIVQYCFHQLGTKFSFRLIFCCVDGYDINSWIPERKKIIEIND